MDIFIAQNLFKVCVKNQDKIIKILRFLDGIRKIIIQKHIKTTINIIIIQAIKLFYANITNTEITVLMI